MKAYILAIVGAVLLSAVVAVIAPSGKMGKFVRGVTKLFILLVMLSPLVSFLGGGKIYDFDINLIEEDSAYLEKCAAILSQKDGEEIAASIAEEFSVTAEVLVEREIDPTFSYKKITVKVTDFGIFGQDAHIHIVTRIKEALETRYGCTAEVS